MRCDLGVLILVLQVPFAHGQQWRPADAVTKRMACERAVANSAMQHSRVLEDRKRFEVFLSDPTTFAMALDRLDAGAAEARGRQAAELVTGGGMLLAALVIWRFRHRFRFGARRW